MGSQNKSVGDDSSPKNQNTYMQSSAIAALFFRDVRKWRVKPHIPQIAHERDVTGPIAKSHARATCSILISPPLPPQKYPIHYVGRRGRALFNLPRSGTTVSNFQRVSTSGGRQSGYPPCVNAAPILLCVYDPAGGERSMYCGNRPGPGVIQHRPAALCCRHMRVSASA